MARTRIALLTLLLLPPTAIQLRAQTPADTVVSDTTTKKGGRFGGLMNKAKQVAGNKTVQNAAKGAATNVACTAVPGAAVAAATGKGPCQNTVMAGLMAKTGIAGAAANMANGTSSTLAAKAIAAAAAAQASNAAAVPSASGVAGAVSGLKGMFGHSKPAPAPTTASATTTGASAATPASPWLNYDFVPGPNTIFYSDFTDDKIGNFPARLQFAEGNMEVAELGGQRVLRATGQSRLSIPLPVTLPERFTIEIDVINRPSIDGADFHLRGSQGRMDDAKTSVISWGSDGVSLAGGGGGEVRLVSGDAMRQRYRGKPAQVRIVGDGKYIKVFLDEKRLANVPNASFDRTNLLNLFIDARGDDNAAYISRIRVAESRVSLYDDMMSGSGRVATQGLLFNSGSAVLNPESAPTLREISSMLVLHPELKLRIEGYTDNVGPRDANVALSTKRSEAVKAALVNGFQIPPNRLDARGMGDAKPLRKDNSAEARQANRRVELVKM
jgi:outer membrane protein OmpA-like peptidoglycan-associated protein